MKVRDRPRHPRRCGAHPPARLIGAGNPAIEAHAGSLALR
jgi:hypothetical protein